MRKPMRARPSICRGEFGDAVERQRVTRHGVAGADTTGGGVIQTLQNNVFQFNNVNVDGALTPLGAL
jgi:hypothetical protein